MQRKRGIYIFDNIKTYFRKHDFDLENPIIIKGINHCIGLFGGSCDVSFQYNKYKCKKCGIEARLDKYDLEKLPRDILRGCKGKVKL